MSAVTMPKSNFSVSSLLNSSNANGNPNNNSNLAANVTANYLNFLNKFRPIGFPTPLSTSRALLAPSTSASHPPESMHRIQDDGVHDDPKAELEGKDLWDQFHQHGTEMVTSFFSRSKKNWNLMFFFLSSFQVITKSGRYVEFIRFLYFEACHLRKR